MIIKLQMVAHEAPSSSDALSQLNVASQVKNFQAGKKIHKSRSVQQGLPGYFAKHKLKQKVIMLKTSITEDTPDMSQDGWETETDDLDHGTIIESNSMVVPSESWVDKVALHQSQLAPTQQGSASDFILPLEGDPSDTARLNHGHGHGHPAQSISSSHGRPSTSLHSGFSQTVSQLFDSVGHAECQVDQSDASCSILPDFAQPMV